LRAIGIRIEDDVLVVPGGRKILTSVVPKTVAEVEAFMADAGSWWRNLAPISVEK
jgi:Xaa-Pro aminopeptidase